MVGAFVGGKYSFCFRNDGTVWYELSRISKKLYRFVNGSPVSSSDATNIRTSIKQERNEIVINGRKWCVYGLDLSFTAEGYLSRIAGGLAGPETRGQKFTSSW